MRAFLHIHILFFHPQMMELKVLLLCYSITPSVQQFHSSEYIVWTRQIVVEFVRQLLYWVVFVCRLLWAVYYFYRTSTWQFIERRLEYSKSAQESNKAQNKLQTKQESKQQLNLQVTCMQFITITRIFYSRVKGACMHTNTWQRLFRSISFIVVLLHCASRLLHLCVHVCVLECVNESEHCARFVLGDDVEWYILFDCYITYSLVAQPHSYGVFFIYRVSSFIFGFIFQLVCVYIFLIPRSHFIFISWFSVSLSLSRVLSLSLSFFLSLFLPLSLTFSLSLSLIVSRSLSLAQRGQ